MIIRILNKAQYLKLFFFFAMGIIVGYELNAESIQIEKNINPFKLYPKDISFEVKRNEEIIGFHKVTFELITDNRISVAAEMKINVFFLGFPIYKYSYFSNAQWQDGYLQNLAAKQNDDGDKSEVIIRRNKKRLNITGPNGDTSGAIELLPSNHWNSRILGMNKVIDTIKGKVADITIQDKGVERIKVKGGIVLATKYVFGGDVDAIVWYHGSGRWVKLQFRAEDNSIIELLCQECGVSEFIMAGN